MVHDVVTFAGLMSPIQLLNRLVERCESQTAAHDQVLRTHPRGRLSCERLERQTTTTSHLGHEVRRVVVTGNSFSPWGRRVGHGHPTEKSAASRAANTRTWRDWSSHIAAIGKWRVGRLPSTAAGWLILRPYLSPILCIYWRAKLYSDPNY